MTPAAASRGNPERRRLGSQRPLDGCRPNMHGQHPFAAKGPGGIFKEIAG